ncbi:MAG: hypothetical protein HC845_05410 [Akkermansiaceae bacterium]|nr:hypothetical protein [Akkermansiaceae bacterium]
MATATTLNINKQPNAVEAGAIYSIQSSTDLSQWLSQGQASSTITSLLDNSETLSVRLETNTANARFYRYGAVLPVAASPAASPALRSVPVSEELPASPETYSDCGIHGCGCVTVKE